MPHLEITKVISVHCNIVNNDYQKDSRFFCVFIPNRSFGQLLDISSKSFKFLEMFNSKFSYTEEWFTDQNSKPLEIKDKIKITWIINY